ncbi:hypothetical protein DSM104443_01729 [Usitatibacter rugosus]|uniref:PapC-like C-terminal domain-containing protein n=1 Tax=Usitatibacter rugosus TaxID=2732067 RepID=A0A6M4GUE6_9PROT|nr:fimbria/pilus outer membrane usher protein [Usitatibacter rugosus]QJR10662.1 hypothetical protein DSM104443_01729 [Usitatibacter rugosus]
MTVRQFLAALLLAAAGLADAWAQDTLVNPYPAFVALRLNGEAVSDGALILRAGAEGKQFFLGAAEARRLRLDLAARVSAVHVDKDDFYPLDGIEGLRYAFDELTQSLAIDAVPAIFNAQQITLPPPALVDATRPGTGAFLTYDLISQQTDAAGQAKNLTSGQAELGIFTPYGVFTQSTFGNANGPDRGLLRLDTLFTIDQPSALASWRIGDTITRAPAWAPLTRFGGIQYGTNFATQPTLITYPLTAMTGATPLPSTVDVYVNNVLSSTLNVPAGPFTLNDLPTVSGQGQLRLVVRDLLGREQVYMQSLYGSTTLLRPGLDDWTIQAGALREDYGIASNEYGAGFASGVWRRGINDDLTIEGAAEGARQHMAVGGGATWVLGAIGQFFAAGAWSQDKPDGERDRREGHLWVYGWERRSTTFNFGAQAKLASESFRTVANGDIPPSRREISAFASYGLGASSIGAGYALIERVRDEPIEFAQLTLTHSFKDWGFVTLSAVKSLSGVRNNQVFLSYALPIDFVTTASVTSTVTEADRTRRTENRVGLQRNLPTGDGYGYRIDISDQERAIADIRYQNRAGLYSLEVARQANSTSARIGASGSLIYMADELIAGRRVEDAFGLVQIPGFPNVRVYLDNQEIGRTNAGGNLFISRLRPYQQNRLSIEQLDIPMSAEVLTLKLDATPYIKSGVVVRFPVKQSLGGIAHFVDETGKDLPSGSIATLVDTGDQFPVAERGQSYLTGLQASNRVRVSWGGRNCAVTIPFKPGDDPQPLLGTYTCRLR